MRVWERFAARDVSDAGVAATLVRVLTERERRKVERKAQRLQAKMIFIENRATALKTGTASTWTADTTDALVQRLKVLREDYWRTWARLKPLLVQLDGTEPEEPSQL